MQLPGRSKIDKAVSSEAPYEIAGDSEVPNGGQAAKENAQNESI